MRAIIAIVVFVLASWAALAPSATSQSAPSYAYVVELQQNPCSPTWLFAVYPTMERCEEALDMLAQTYPGYHILIHSVEVRR